MKKNLKFITAGIIVGAASLYLAAPLMPAIGAPIYGAEKNLAFGPEKFSVSINQVNNSGKINLHVEKGNTVRLIVTLRNASGDIVNELTINKKQTDFNQDYDFSQADEGIYNLIVSDGHQTVSKKINYQRPQLVTLAKFTIN